MKLLVIALVFIGCTQAYTPWQLLGHNNFRFRSTGKSTSWKTSNMMAKNFHYTRWDVPFGASADQNGGAALRDDDGHVFVQILGTIAENMQEWVGAEKRFGPPFVWELDGDTGKTVRMYNLSMAGDVFESPLRFTPSGNPMVAVQSKKKGFQLVVLDRNSDQILTVMKPPTEPLLLFPTNTNPPSAVMASMNDIATIEFDSTGKTFAPGTAKRTSAISTIMFGVDGLTMYNGAVNLESQGLYRYKLPIKSNSAQKLTSGISPYPWELCDDTAGNVYGLYGGQAKSYDNTGKSRWATPAPGFWIAMSDDEKSVIAGDSKTIAVKDAATGQNRYAPIVIGTDLKQSGDTKFSCTFSEQPWAPRHPLIMVDGRLSVLCRNQNGFFMSSFDVMTGQVSNQRAYFNMSNVDVLTGDSNNNVYAYGIENGAPTVQKIHV